MKTIRLVAVAAILCLAASALAEIKIDTVPVGNPGNKPELSGKGAGGLGEDRRCGKVDYAYEMGTFEVTAEQYTAFLNAVARTDTYGLHNPAMSSEAEGCQITRSGEPDSYTYAVAEDWARRPVNFVSWGDAARFANWLHNGQPTGDQDRTTTEDGSYRLNGAMDNAALLKINRRASATWVIPSEDEWYKAAFHRNDGVTGNYWDYATSSDTLPTNKMQSPDPGNTANYQDKESGSYTLGPPYWRTPVGAFEKSKSPYGTFDQDGNLWEWIEAVQTQQGQSRRGVRGASYFTVPVHLQAADRHFALEPVMEHQLAGFRVARVNVEKKEAAAEPPALVQLTDDRHLNGYSEWFPDGSYIIYTSAREDYNLWRVSPDGGESVRITEFHAHHGRFSPDGKYIVFDGDAGSVVRIMPATGGVPIRIVPASVPVENSGNPIWSPDGPKIAFRSIHAIYVLDLGSGEFSKIYENEARIPIPLHWSKTEECLLVSLLNPEDKTAQVWRLPLGGGEPTQLTFTPRVTQASPAPDESCFVYASVGEGRTLAEREWDLWIMPFAGGESLRLTSGQGRNMEPRWSPDGSRIVFMSTRNGAPDLYVMKVDLQKIRRDLDELNGK
ncbi:MAG: SUMF1/EgtB/PvdO family nonheme iron enzyme [Phycisphaerae bacterium]|jgi:formylglycine-generating enzyme required for sulfatase activity